MRINILRHLNPSLFPNGCVATIGNFDGVHRGHQTLLKQLMAIAAEKNLPLVIVLFESQPLEFFQGDKAPARLTRWREKIDILRAVNVGTFILTLRFNQQLANLTAQEFIDKILVQGLNVKYVMAGNDFRFGKERAGNVALLKKIGQQENFSVIDLPTITEQNERISSTRIRAALAAHDLVLAADLLGRPYAMTGRVVQGDKIGRQLGFSTANIRLQRLQLPLRGVYAVKLRGISEKPCLGVANVGSRPTRDGIKNLLEVHLFDFDKDIYGKQVTVEFLEFIRAEQKFDSLDLLKQQIAKDVAATKQFFENSTI